MKEIDKWLVIIASLIATSLSANNQLVNLALDLEQAKSLKVPIMLVFVDDDCEDCEKINEEIIKPMKISGDYNDKVIIRIINIDEDKIIDFDGVVSEVENIANRYNLELTPTVSFVDDSARKISPSISGMSNLDYYGSLLDESINNALKKMRIRGQEK